MLRQTLTSPRRDATYSVPARDVVSNRFVALGDGMSSPGFMIAHFIWCCLFGYQARGKVPVTMHDRTLSEAGKLPLVSVGPTVCHKSFLGTTAPLLYSVIVSVRSRVGHLSPEPQKGTGNAHIYMVSGLA